MLFQLRRLSFSVLSIFLIMNSAAAQQSIKMLQIYITGKNDKIVAQTIQQYQGLGNPPLAVQLEVVTLDVFNTLTSLDQSFTATAPLTGATSNTKLRNYDVIFFGICDSYASKDLTAAGAARVREFAAAGKGLIFSHDTVFWSEGGKLNFDTFGDITGLKTSGHIGVIFTEVRNVAADKTASFLKQPFVLPETFAVTSTHQTHQGVADGTLWYESTGNGQPYLATHLNPSYHSRCAFINYGHLQQAPPEYEAKALINTIHFVFNDPQSEITNLVIEKTSWSPDPVMAAEPVTFELTIKNTGTKKWSARDIVVDIRAIDFSGTGPDDSFWLKMSGNYAQMRENDQKTLSFTADIEPGQSVIKQFKTAFYAADYIDGLELQLMPGSAGGLVDDDPAGNLVEPRLEIEFGNEPYINCLSEIFTGLTHGIVNMTAACHTVMALNKFYDYGPAMIMQMSDIAEHLKKDEFAQAGELTATGFMQIYSDILEELADNGFECGGSPVTDLGKTVTVLSFFNAAMDELQGRGCGAVLVHEAVKFKNREYITSLLASFNSSFCKYFNTGASCVIVASPANIKISSDNKIISIDSNGNEQIDPDLGTAFLFGEIKCAMVIGDQDKLIELQGTDTGSVNVTIINGDETGSTSTLQYNNIPVTAVTRAKLAMGTGSNNYSLQVDENGDGTFEKSVQPESSATVDISILVKDESGVSKELHVGLHPDATEGVDNLLGEEELPPFPVSGVFEARLVGQHINMAGLGEGTYTDYRKGDANFDGQTIHEIRFQPSIGQKATLNWQFPAHVTGLLEDMLGGIVVKHSLSGNGSVTITNAGALQFFKLTLTYGKPEPKKKIEIPLTIHDGSGISRELFFGLAPDATDGMDAALGEEELPPLPPQGIFDARFIGTDIGLNFGQGMAKDLRTGGALNQRTHHYELQFQPSSGTNISISWNLPEGVSGVMEDLFGGIIVKQNMSESGSLTVTNAAINKLKMSITYNFATGICDHSTPASISLLQNYPNPFNPSTTIRYEVKTSGVVKITIYNAKGERVKSLTEKHHAPGSYEIKWDGANEAGQRLASGLYYYRLDGNHSQLTKPMILIK